MTPRPRFSRLSPVSACLALAVATGAAQQPAAPQRPQFRAAADIVFVDVAVRGGLGNLIDGLTASDFVLTDNGVRQQIDSVEPVDLPIDLTLVADVSDDPNGSDGRPIARLDPANFPRQINDEVRRTATLLRAGDRLRVVSSGTYAMEVQPFAPVTAGAAEFSYDGPVGGLSSLHDTIAAVLLHPVPPDRRHIVLVNTKAVDTLSALEADAIRAIAERSPAMLHVVLMEAALQDAAEMRRFQCETAGFCEASRRFWVPFRRPSQAVLTEAARLTGGGVHVSELFREPSFENTFRKILDDFRRSYVLRYSPRGVSREGWHEIAVRTPRAQEAVVYARRGYFVEPADRASNGTGSDVRAATAAATSTVPPNAEALVAAFERGNVDGVAAALLSVPDPARIIRDVSGLDNLWAATPAREAAFVLLLAEAGLFSQRDDARKEAQALLTSYQVAIRHPLEPDAFEREWLFAELALVQGLVRPEVAAPFVANARERFPDEPRFLLAEAIIADQRWRDTGPPMPPAATIDDVVSRYESAIAHPETADEARVRLGFFLHRVGRHADAIARLNAIGSGVSRDRPVHFFQQLFRGHSWLALGQFDAAAAAYDAALAVWPDAPSARVGLMHTRLRQGDREAAAALANTIQTAPDTITDPWWRYWNGAYRFFQPAVRRVAAAGR